MATKELHDEKITGDTRYWANVHSATTGYNWRVFYGDRATAYGGHTKTLAGARKAAQRGLRTVEAL